MKLSEKSRRLVRFVIAIVGGLIAIPVVLVLAWFVYSRYIVWRYDRPFERITRGDTQERVVSLMGKPDLVDSEHQTQLVWRSGEHDDYSQGDCVVQFRYTLWSPFGDEYVVGFDASKHAVSKYEVTSP